ncbi:MAG: acyl-CoA thioesterase [Hyphomonas sp.]
MADSAPLAISEIHVSFGDCDPAGIVFYPNYFRWTDALFHRFLDDKVGGHARLCNNIGAVGLGLIAVEMSFRSPVAPGQSLMLRLDELAWHDKSLELRYSGHLGDRTAFVAMETRGVFMLQDGRMRAGPTAALRTRLG